MDKTELLGEERVMENLTAQFLHSATLQKLPPPLWSPSFLTSFTSLNSRPPIPSLSSSSLRRSFPLLSLDGFAEDAMQPTSLLLSDSHHHHQRFLSSLLRRLDRPGSCPLRLLQEDGDWSKDHFWAVIRFLRHSSRLHDILPVNLKFPFLYKTLFHET